MSKVKTTFFCQNCGAQSAQWMGKCNSCGAWNTIVEEIVTKSNLNQVNWENEKSNRVNKAQAIGDISLQARARIDTYDNELNRVLGGGIVAGSLILLGGEPGIGKSTLLLQVALRIQNEKILYVTGEESDQQIRMRADRLNLSDSNCKILTETNTQHIFQQIQEVQPTVLVIDSIQTLHTNSIDSSTGSISQIRECTAELMNYAKASGTPVLLIGHINKDGNIAGPKILEHMVDVVLQFEGDPNLLYRILRAHKNRFGSTDEIGLYTMEQSGLLGVANPSDLLLTKQHDGLSGNAVAVLLEGVRPMLLELQALCSTAVYGTPQRSTTGFDTRRLNMLLAVLEKRCGFRLGQKDVFLNITGGLRVDDPALDLAVIASILSSNADEPISQKFCFAGEVGLTGEVRPISKVEQRIREAEKLGFEKIYISGHHQIEKSHYNIAIVGLKRIEELVKAQF